jgi:hypothetical protein
MEQVLSVSYCYFNVVFEIRLILFHNKSSLGGLRAITMTLSEKVVSDPPATKKAVFPNRFH